MIFDLAEDFVQLGQVIAKLVRKRQLGLTGAQAFDQTAIGVQTVIGAAKQREHGAANRPRPSCSLLRIGQRENSTCDVYFRDGWCASGGRGTVDTGSPWKKGWKCSVRRQNEEGGAGKCRACSALYRQNGYSDDSRGVSSQMPAIASTMLPSQTDCGGKKPSLALIRSPPAAGNTRAESAESK